MESALDILIIDDSKFMRRFCAIHLSDAGFEVIDIEPTSLFEVLGAIREHRPRLVITDYEMPFCNGETLIRAIREDTFIRDTPVLVISAHSETDLVNRLSNWSLAAYLLKPISPAALVEQVSHLLKADQ